MYHSLLKKTALTVALAGMAVSAQAMQVQTMTAGSGTFQDNYVSPSQTSLVGSSWANTADPAANLVGGFVNLGQISTNQFNGYYVYAFTSDGTTAPDGGTPTGVSAPVPSFTVTATGATTGTISGNLSSWTVYYAGDNNNQGPTDANGNPISVSGTWDPATGVYNIAWTSFTALSGGTLTSSWTMTGTATPVPEAPTSAMMLVGLALLGTVTSIRKRRTS